MSHKTAFRLPSGGRLDRDQRIDFRLDGRPMSGYRGDTLASALLANGVTLVGRSFKYHRPRGFLTAGPDEPNGLFTLGEGGRTDPNVPGTTVELVQGLAARRQNGWPSVELDLMGLVSLGKPLLAAGFYYKTFMGPTRRSWMFYERFIRRAAGLGRAVHEPDPDRYETRNAFADVLVVGAGPAGLAAALTAGRAGARVTLVEQDTVLGGALLLEGATGVAEEWRRQVEAQLESLANVEILRRTSALGVYDGNKVALLERRDALCADADRRDARQVITTLRARTIILATGATERPLVFANNDRPGVMLASAARCYLNRFGVVCAGRALVVTNNDTAYETAFDLAASGVSVGIADCRRTIAPTLATRATALDIEVRAGAAIVDVLGRRTVKGALLADATGAGPVEHWTCDGVYMSGGWSPTVHLTSHGGIKPRYRADIAAFVPGGYAASHFGAGALTGTFALAAAIEEGVVAGRNAAAHVGLAAGVPDLPVTPPARSFAIEFSTPSVQRRQADAFVDFQNDVTAKDLLVAHQEGYRSVEHLKRYTTLGMGTDQGRTSNVNALAVMAGLRGIAIPEVGTTTFRPPFTPVAIGALAGRNTGLRFRPIRRSPLHHWHVANGGELIEAGPWMRPWYYRWAGKTVQTAYVEEMRQVRSGVGIADVSTLGKLDIQGPDAAEFINRVYVNSFTRLPIGKARYGVMLRDDGAVLDDGTTTRLSETRYFMTTSTGHAEEVTSWLEFLLQTAWTDLRVHVTSVTDEWAAMALAGPKARMALELALPGLDFSDSKLPHMACVEVDLDGVPLRVLRLSFSGELAFELYVPAGQGIGLWQHLLARAAPVGLKPYGLEALASLRIEKGYIAGLELDHRNTLDDLGLGKMAARDKAFVGRALRQRQELQASNRWSLVGIESLEPGKTLRSGAILFAVTDRIAGHGRGYITSVTWSTELRKFIALGLYQGGLRHEHEKILCAYPVREELVQARIVAPQFVDPEGRRLRV
jgi:methylglutamate dehydrogenase subunit C